VGLSRLMPGAPGRTQLEAAAGGPHVPPASTMLDSRLVGTPSYMDPEYLRTGRFGPKSDTYSLGEWGEVSRTAWRWTAGATGCRGAGGQQCPLVVA
jgi:serine/threonine protein kinase